MVFKYKRKTNRGSWSEETMQKAMDDAKATTISAASKKYGIPIGTLHRHIKKGDASKKLGRFQPVFSKEMEQKLCDLAIERDNLFYGLTKESLQTLAFELATQNKIAHPFACEKAGRAWVEGFMARHPQLTYRTPEPTALARCSAFNRTQVDRFYDNLWTVLSNHQFLARPDDIYNMDETGVKTSASRPPRVISVKGKRQVGVVATAEKGQLTTVICACNATGRYIPPSFIFGQRKRMNERLLDGAPNGSQAWCSESGWITNITFNNWLQIFIDKTRPTADRPVLLILDNHTTHQNLEALNLARKNHVIMVSIPPHTSHKLQPLDVSVYRSFKVAFEQTIDTFQKNHPGRRVTQFDVASLVRVAYEKSATVQNATSGFRKAGIFPYNKNLFTDLDFTPATVYENAPVIEGDENIAATDEGDTSVTRENSTSIGSNTLAEAQNPVTQEDDDVTDAEDGDVTDAEDVLVTEGGKNAPINVDEGNGDNPDDITESSAVVQVSASENKEDECTTKSTDEDQVVVEDSKVIEGAQDHGQQLDKTLEEDILTTTCFSDVTNILEQPSTSYIVSPRKLLPPPKVTPTIKKRKVRSQKSEILTSSPFIAIIEKKTEMRKKPKLDLDQNSEGKGKKRNKKEINEKKGQGTNDSKRTTKGKGKGKGKRTKKEKTLQNDNESTQDVFCLFCGEKYIEPPTEDWIQCPTCLGWAHELCTDIDDGRFLCVNCKM